MVGGAWKEVKLAAGLFRESLHLKEGVGDLAKRLKDRIGRGIRISQAP